LLRPGGVVAFDDYSGASDETRSAIDAFLATHAGELDVVWTAFVLIAVKR